MNSAMHKTHYGLRATSSMTGTTARRRSTSLSSRTIRSHSPHPNLTTLSQSHIHTPDTHAYTHTYTQAQNNFSQEMSVWRTTFETVLKQNNTTIEEIQTLPLLKNAAGADKINSTAEKRNSKADATKVLSVVKKVKELMKLFTDGDIDDKERLTIYNSSQY
jgi:predicted secreted protein